MSFNYERFDFTSIACNESHVMNQKIESNEYIICRRIKTAKHTYSILLINLVLCDKNHCFQSRCRKVKLKHDFELLHNKSMSRYETIPCPASMYIYPNINLHRKLCGISFFLFRSDIPRHILYYVNATMVS